MQTSAQSANNLTGRPEFSKALFSGLIITLIFLLGFLSWALTAPLNSAAIAPGIITVEQGRKTVAHLEGGIVGEILIAEGNQVKAGQVLLQLDNENALASYRLLQDRLNVALALEARLKAEYHSLTAIEYPTQLISGNSQSIINGQNNIFSTRVDALNTRKEILQQRITQLQAEVAGIKGQLRSEKQQRHLLADEIKLVAGMYRQKLVDKPHLLQLQRKAQEIEGRINLHQAQIAKAEQNIGETQLRIVEIDTTRNSEVAEELRDVQAELLDLNNRLQAARDVHERSTIVAPISGTIVALQVHTQGGVIRPGEAILDIVPDGEGLLVEARVSPNDIDVVHSGMDAQLRLTAFNQRTTPQQQGVVESVSADHLTDEVSGENYYLARIRLKANSLTETALKPGMKAEVMIVTGERTLVEYLLEPLSNSLNRAFRES